MVLMMRRLLPLSLMLALLIATGLRTPSAVLACLPDPNYDPWSDSTVIVLGQVVGQYDAAYNVTAWNFEVSHVLKGDSPETIGLRPGLTDCDVAVHEGDWYILAIHSDTLPGSFRPTQGKVFGIGDPRGSEEAVGTSWLEEHTQDEGTPWAVILPLALGIPLATLLIPALLRRRSAGH